MQNYSSENTALLIVDPFNDFLSEGGKLWSFTQETVKGVIYPALGSDLPGNFAYSSLQSLASNVTGITVPLSGHWIPEEQPKFVIDQLFKFFRN